LISWTQKKSRFGGSLVIGIFFVPEKIGKQSAEKIFIGTNGLLVLLASEPMRFIRSLLSATQYPHTV
jgi:hypothetical protein